METISNEEKANELAKCDCQKHYKGFSICNTDKFQGKNYCALKARTLQAMEWKDEQFKTQKQQMVVWEAKTDKDMIWYIIDTLNHCGVTKHGFEVKDMVAWLEELERNL